MRTILFCSALLGLTAGAQMAKGEAILQFTGTIVDGDPILGAAFSLGEQMVGTLTYDTSSPDLVGSPTFGFYDAITSYQVAFEGGYSASDDGSDVQIDINPAVPYSFAAESSLSPIGPSVAGLQLEEMWLELIDDSQTVFGSDALPTNLDLNDFNLRVFRLFFEGNQNRTKTHGKKRAQVIVIVDTLTVVPEPGSVMLLGLGGLALALSYGARRRRALRSAA